MPFRLFCYPVLRKKRLILELAQRGTCFPKKIIDFVKFWLLITMTQLLINFENVDLRYTGHNNIILPLKTRFQQSQSKSASQKLLCGGPLIFCFCFCFSSFCLFFFLFFFFCINFLQQQKKRAAIQGKRKRSAEKAGVDVDALQKYFSFFFCFFLK